MTLHGRGFLRTLFSILGLTLLSSSCSPVCGRRIDGFEGIQLLGRTVGDEVEFITIMRFVSIDAVREFAGEDYEAAVIPPKARALLSRLDDRSQHYEIRVDAG